MKFKRLKDAKIKIPEYFFESLDTGLLDPLSKNLEIIGEGSEFDYADLAQELDLTCQRFEKNKEKSDGEAAELIHQKISIDRRTASFASFWHYCTVFEFTDYLRWRWKEKNTINQDRILGAWRRNAIGRLWWWAEITKDSTQEDKYFWTKKCSVSQELILHSVDDLVTGNNNIMACMCRQLFINGTTPDRELVRRVFAKLNGVLDTVVLDVLQKSEQESIISQLIAESNSELKVT